jgi:hypothetical protein
MAGDPLTLAIKRHQALRGGTQDGRISPAQTNQNYDWMIKSLSNNISNYLSSLWPHIDKHPKCPATLKPIVQFCVGPHPG